MPRTVNEGFDDFLKRLTPSTAETEAARAHRASIETCLERNFGLRRLFRSGSFGNGTSISGHSDTDYFASIPTEKLSSNSDTSLARFREALDARFPRTGVRVNCPAVKVPFGTMPSETIEVVPADLVEVTGEKYYIYDIPNCDGGWMRSSPDAHNSYVQRVDRKLDGRVKPLIRFVKAWKYYRQVPISSFYLEMRAAKYAEEEKSIHYDIDLEYLFKRLDDRGLAKMQDPQGITGYIHPCSTDAKLEEARSKVATAATRAAKARSAVEEGDLSSAFFWWNRLYDDNFPSYYR